MLMRHRAQTLIEYALIAAFIAIVAIAALTLVGNSASQKLSEVGSAIRR